MSSDTNDGGTRYGLPTSAKDAVEYTTEFQGEEFTIVARPPTIPEMDEYENLPEDISWEDLYDICDKHLEQPELPPKDEALPRNILAYNMAIREMGTVGATQFDRDVLDELQDKAGEPGN